MQQFDESAKLNSVSLEFSISSVFVISRGFIPRVNESYLWTIAVILYPLPQLRYKFCSFASQKVI